MRLIKPVRNREGDLVFSKAHIKTPDADGTLRLYTCPDQGTAKDDPGTTGVPEEGCEPILDSTIYVGVTNMKCSNARRVAKRAVRGNDQYPKWNCTGVGTNFGHCHGHEARRGKIAHWAGND